MKRILLCLFLMLFFCGCDKECTVRPVEVLRVEESKGGLNKTFSGTAISDIITTLAFQVDGQIMDIYVKTGDYVKKGQVLARLNNELYALEVSENEMKVKDAIVRYQNAENYSERIDKLHAEGGISDSDWDRAKTNAKSAQYQIQIAKDRLAYSAKKSSYAALIAPYDGQVVEPLVLKGTYVNAGQNVMDFQGGGFSEVKIFVPQNYINKLYNLKSAKITFDVLKNKTYTGKIKSISPSADSSYVVKVKMDKIYPEIKAGMSAYVTFTFWDKEGIFIPLSAVVDGKYVWVAEQGRAKKREVELGDLDSGEVKVISGLKNGDLIVAKGALQIHDNQKVCVDE